MMHRSVQLSIPFNRETLDRLHEAAGVKAEPVRGRGRPRHVPVLDRLESGRGVVLASKEVDPEHPWTERERKAWAPPENLTVSEWAERDRMLPSKTSAASGQ